MGSGRGGLHDLERFTQKLNVFNRFFRSINRLFAEIRWLRSNILHSHVLLLLAVGVIALYAVYAMQPCCWIHDHLGSDERVDHALLDAAPLVLVASIVGFLLFLRVTGTQSHGKEGQRRAGYHGHHATSPRTHPHSPMI